MIDHGTPIGRLEDQTPVVHGALGAIFHLEALVPDDEARLERVNDMVWSWFGSELSWARLSCADEPEPARREHLDYVSTFPASLRGVADPDPMSQFVSNALHMLMRMDYGVSAYGGETARGTTPFSYRFWAEPGEPPRDKPDLRMLSALQLTVPEAWPLEDFYAKVVQIAAELRLRWGAAGYTYAVNDTSDLSASEEAVFAHARRFTGYDVPAYVRQMNAFDYGIRSVNWLTFVGPGLLERLAAAGRKLEPTPRIGVAQVGDAWMLTAGARPERGDLNRLWVPPAYREVDALLRPVRLSGGLDFLLPWDEAKTTEWLRRFEHQV